jgi:hypothetical protein
VTKRRNIWLAVGALVAGVCTGQIFRQGGHESRENASHDSTSEQISVEDVQSIGSGRKPRPRRTVDDGIFFSRKQWSQLVRNPGLGKIAMADYLDATKQLEDKVPILGDIPVIGRLFVDKAANDLAAQEEFFGWDVRQTQDVRAALIRFGEDLAAAEKTGVRVEYPVGGGARIDFSASQAQRVEIAEKLKRELAEALGERDAERFAVLSRMEGLTGDLPESIDIVGPDLEVIIYTDPDAPDDKTILPDVSSSIIKRIRHLDLRSDWKRATQATLPTQK